MKGGTVQINWHETKPVLTLDFHPLSATLATGGADFDIKLWSINSAEAQKKLPVVTYLNSLSYHSSAVNVIRFSSSGELLASGADGGDLIIWKLHATDTGQTWKVLKMLRSHHKDVLDLQWSPDAAFIISGSVDNSCIIWDVNKGTNLQTLDAHAHYVQGVAWDPLGKYVASLSSDRTCRIYMNRPKKSKGSERINYVCQQIISKAEYPLLENSKSINYHLFHDETLPSFFRRLAWSPDGSFLLVPAGSYRITSGSESMNAAYIFSRKDFSRPAIQLPCASKAVVAVRFCPINFSLRGINSAGLFKLPYRIIFAVATLNSLYIYDTENNPPIAIMAGLHYASITDIAWSPDAHYLALSSQDGYCTLVEFENNELGSPISLSGEKEVSNTDGKKSLRTADGMVIEATRIVGSVEAESSKTEAEAKVDDVVTEGTSNVDVVVAESRKTEAEEKGDDMVIEEPSNCGEVIAESRKMEAEEKDDMVIDATGNVGAVVTDSSKNEAEDRAEKQPVSSDTMKSEAKEMAENQPYSLVNVGKEAEERTEELRSSSDGIKSAEAEKQTSSLDNLKREAEEKVACSSKGMPMSNKQGKKRITPIAIDP